MVKAGHEIIHQYSSLLGQIYKSESVPVAEYSQLELKQNHKRTRAHLIHQNTIGSEPQRCESNLLLVGLVL